MRHIYMHNFRGFTETLIPLRAANFLVGENSTGKSSFLMLLRALANPSFLFQARFPLMDDMDIGGYGDLVSAWAEDRSFFRVGEIEIVESEGRHDCRFAVYTFSDNDGIPLVCHYSQLTDGRLTTLVFDKKRTKYRTAPSPTTFASEAQALRHFRKLIGTECTESTGFAMFPSDVPPRPPVVVALSIVQSLESGDRELLGEFLSDFQMSGRNLTWLAPIRTKPLRIYDGSRRGFSPEGEHVPLLLRRSLRSGAKSRRLAQRLETFGQASGLFESVTTHSFGRGSQTPFEILVRFKGADLNISNVGYGVSQVLPLIVEFLTAGRGEDFAVQQPEVHLHPRAQAALGELLFELVEEGSHNLFVETHSDYLIDRYRWAKRDAPHSRDAQVLFFKRTASGNSAHTLPIAADGSYPARQPRQFRDFFINEEFRLLDI